MQFNFRLEIFNTAIGIRRNELLPKVSKFKSSKHLPAELLNHSKYVTESWLVLLIGYVCTIGATAILIVYVVLSVHNIYSLIRKMFDVLFSMCNENVLSFPRKCLEYCMLNSHVTRHCNHAMDGAA